MLIGSRFIALQCLSTFTIFADRAQAVVRDLASLSSNKDRQPAQSKTNFRPERCSVAAAMLRNLRAQYTPLA